MKNFPCLMSLLLACGSWIAAPPAHAVISCTVSSSGFTSIYDTTAGTPNDNVGNATITCTRAGGDPFTQAYTLATDQGTRSSSDSYRAHLSSDITYDVYKDSIRTTRWAKNNSFAGTINFGAGTSVTFSIPYYPRIPAAQIVPAGIYTDTVAMTLAYGSASALASYPVQIYVNTNCLISTAPNNIVFSYASFQNTAASASTTYAASCTSGLPYTMSLDASSGTLLGINYSLMLPVTSATGTGGIQTYSINGTAAANQVGSCATATCSASATRTLTITY